MTVGYLEALAGIAVSLSILTAIAWMVQQRTGHSGWLDTIWTFSVGLAGAGSALWPAAGAAPNARQWLVATLVAVWSLRLGLHIARRSSAISDDPRHAAFGRDRGLGAPRRMFFWILAHVAGIPPLERQMLRSRGARYRDYQTRTGAFFPLPPQKGLVT